MKGIEFLILSALILANLMFTFDAWYHLLNYKDTEVKKKRQKNLEKKL